MINQAPEKYAREQERAAIVAHLKDRARLCAAKRQPSWAKILTMHADAIERLAHLNEGDK